MRYTLKSPPYSRDLRKQGGGVWLYFGGHEAWSRAKGERALGWCNVLVLPVGEQPADFDWSCINGLSVVVIEVEGTSDELRQALVRALAIYGAEAVYLVPRSRQWTDVVMWNCGPGNLKGAA